MARRKHQFDFKEFSIIQKQAAMKVGTDAVLLGAWADVKNCEKILDVGTGTGLIALMLAQRNATAQIDAIEIDELTANEAQFNFDQSPWKSRLTVIHEKVQHYATKVSVKYDLIVSNPPYFSAGTASPHEIRHQARHDLRLPLIEFMDAADALLQPHGTLSVIIPAPKRNEFLVVAHEKQLFLTRETAFYSKKGKPVERWLFELKKLTCSTHKSELVHYNSAGEWSEDYISLTKDFYLKL